MLEVSGGEENSFPAHFVRHLGRALALLCGAQRRTAQKAQIARGRCSESKLSAEQHARDCSLTTDERAGRILQHSFDVRDIDLRLRRALAFLLLGTYI